jgi:hypothetical protein
MTASWQAPSWQAPGSNQKDRVTSMRVFISYLLSNTEMLACVTVMLAMLTLALSFSAMLPVLLQPQELLTDRITNGPIGF